MSTPELLGAPLKVHSAPHSNCSSYLIATFSGPNFSHGQSSSKTLSSIVNLHNYILKTQFSSLLMTPDSLEAHDVSPLLPLAVFLRLLTDLSSSAPFSFSQLGRKRILGRVRSACPLHSEPFLVPKTHITCVPPFSFDLIACSSPLCSTHCRGTPLPASLHHIHPPKVSLRTPGW